MEWPAHFAVLFRNIMLLAELARMPSAARHDVAAERTGR
jgi:hypothetical protein